MRLLISMVILLSATNATAWRGRIHCKDGDKVVSSKRTDLADFREACEQKLLDNKACFTGEKNDVASLLIGEMADFEFFSDEMRIEKVLITRQDSVKFTLFDMPNEWTVGEYEIKRCLPGFFAR